MTFPMGISYQKASGIMEKFLAYNRNYKGKAAFTTFFCKNFIITGDSTDFVFRRDLHEEFGKFAGETQYSTTEVGKQLLASGLKVTRLSRQYDQEYGYRGIRFLDGRGRVYFPCTKPKEGKRKLQEEVEIPQVNIHLDSTLPSLDDIVQKYRQNKNMWKDFLNHPQNYNTKEDFINFCKQNIVFTGICLDFVFQKDLTNEFSSYCGETFHSAVPLGMHLAAAGVRKIRLGKSYKQEYGYIGMCFADGRGRKYVPHTPHGNIAGDCWEDEQQQGSDAWPESSSKRLASDPQQSQTKSLFEVISEWENDEQQQYSAMAAPSFNDSLSNPPRNIESCQQEPASLPSSEELAMQDLHTKNPPVDTEDKAAHFSIENSDSDSDPSFRQSVAAVPPERPVTPPSPERHEHQSLCLADFDDDDINSIFLDMLAHLNEGHVEEPSGNTNLEQQVCSFPSLKSPVAY